MTGSPSHSKTHGTIALSPKSADEPSKPLSATPEIRSAMAPAASSSLQRFSSRDATSVRRDTDAKNARSLAARDAATPDLATSAKCELRAADEHPRRPKPTDVRAQLLALERSPLFAHSDRLISFLRFVVDETLDGRSSYLKESVIGNAVYGRSPSYDPRIDSTVRVEARRLRSKLTDYYAGEGRLDPVRISLPTGGYVPVIESNVATDEVPPAASEGAGRVPNIFRAGEGSAIAIMPFRALARFAEDEAFADGLTDEMIYVIGRSQGLRIVSRGTALQYKDSGYSVSKLAHELHVDALLQGTVRREANSLLVTIEVSAPSGFIVWSDRFEAPVNDRAGLSERIAATVLSRVRFDSSRMRARKIGPGPVALQALSMVLRARQLLEVQAPDGLNEALALFTEVSRSAPDYARGHSGVADTYCNLYRLGLLDAKTASAAARPAAARAVQIDPESIEGHTALGSIAGWIDWDHRAASAHLQRALAVGTDARAARQFGLLLTVAECHAEAQRWLRESRALEPLSVQQDIAEALCHYQSRQYEKLTTAAYAAGLRIPTEVLAYSALAHIFTGDLRGARELIARIDDQSLKFPHWACARAELEARLGEPERGRRMLDQMPGEVSHFARASLAAALQANDCAVTALHEAMDRRELPTVWIRTDGRFDQLRCLPSFQSVVERLNVLQGQRTPKADER